MLSDPCEAIAAIWPSPRDELPFAARVRLESIPIAVEDLRQAIDGGDYAGARHQAENLVRWLKDVEVILADRVGNPAE